MAVQDTRPVALGQALQPNIWDIVALVLVTGAMVLIVYGGGQTTAPLSALKAPNATATAALSTESCPRPMVVGAERVAERRAAGNGCRVML